RRHRPAARRAGPKTGAGLAGRPRRRPIAALPSPPRIDHGGRAGGRPSPRRLPRRAPAARRAAPPPPPPRPAPPAGPPGPPPPGAPRRPADRGSPLPDNRGDPSMPSPVRSLAIRVRPAAVAGLTLLSTAVAHAEEAAPPPIDSGDTAWVLTASALVLMMTLPGL